MLAEDKKFFPKVTIPYSPTLFGVKMPILSVKFREFPQPVQALVDSGATNSMLHPRVASALKLKLDYSKKLKGTGAGGQFEYIESEPVETELLNQKYSIKFHIPMDDNFAWPCILGHNSIFRLSKIEFRTYKQEFCVSLRADIN